MEEENEKAVVDAMVVRRKVEMEEEAEGGREKAEVGEGSKLGVNVWAGRDRENDVDLAALAGDSHLAKNNFRAVGDEERHAAVAATAAVHCGLDQTRIET